MKINYFYIQPWDTPKCDGRHWPDTRVGHGAQSVQLPEQDPVAPDIRLGGVDLVLETLRGHPLDGQLPWAHLGVGLVHVHVSRHSEIWDFANFPRLSQQNISGCQVSVNNLQFFIFTKIFSFRNAYLQTFQICHSFWYLKCKIVSFTSCLLKFIFLV